MWKVVASLAAVAALSGCAGVYQLNNDVTTFSQWPGGRQPMTYAFERLPSQQSDPARQQLLEDAARPAVEMAGFKPAAAATAADVNVQLSARVDADPRSMYYGDPFMWNGGFHYGFGYGRRGYRGAYFGGAGWGYGGPGWGFSPPVYEREVSVLIRDRSSGQVLFETRASNDGNSTAIAGLLPAMFEAALKDFPTGGGASPRRVVTTVQPPPKTP